MFIMNMRKKSKCFILLKFVLCFGYRSKIKELFLFPIINK